MFIDKKYIQKNYDFYKVITTHGNGNQGFGIFFICYPNEIFN